MDVIEIKTYEYYVFSSREATFFVNTVILLYGRTARSSALSGSRRTTQLR
jgi:hypothetical protein